MMSKYWHPQHKYQLVEWFHLQYPTKSVSKWERMSKKQLYGKYKEVRDGLNY
jgi:hypothetical protein